MTISFLTAAFTFLLFSPAVEGQNPVDRALANLLRTDANTFWIDLGHSRPQAVSPEFKAAVLDTLPLQGEIRNLKEPARRKLAATHQIFQMHERDAVYEIKVIDVPSAFVGLHARSVILVSQAALDLLSAEELQASVAHEAGHEYIWSQYEAARERKDFERLQELELFCDVVSVLTLRRAGLDPSRLITCFEKLLRYTHEFFQLHENEARYVPARERKRFVETVIKWAAGGESAAAR
jgi:hypothetical protein